MVTKDGGAKVKEGNARVVRARLSDGEFYWEQDRKTLLVVWSKYLNDVVFHAKVGMMSEKVGRITDLAREIAKEVGYPNEKEVIRAAMLCKADLVTGMVGEFPELQGIMGRYYARHQNESNVVAEAIYEHYKPQGANDGLPVSDLGAIISIADKLDSIISLFAVGEKPTGSKDPLALRRAALGVLRILHDRRWNIDLAKFCTGEVIEFFNDRLKQLLRDNDVDVDIIEAASHKTSEQFIPALLSEQIKNLATWRQTTNGKDSLAAIKRAMNILAAEEKKDKKKFGGSVSSASAPAEKAIAAALITPKTPKDLEALTAPINQFFTDLMVNEEGHRESRLALLAAVREAANHIADFSKIEG